MSSRIFLPFIALLMLTACSTLRTSKAHEEQNVAPSISAEQQRKFDYYFLESVRQRSLGEHSAAYDLLQHCLSIDPYSPVANNELASYYYALKQPDKAIAAMQVAVRYAPDNYWYSQALANIYQRQGRSEEASAVLEQMVSRFPGKLEPVYSLVDVYARLGKYDKVIELLDNLEERVGKSEQLSMEKFRILVRLGDTAAAYHTLEQLIADYPEEARYLLIKADILNKNGKAEEGKQMMKRALQLDPTIVQARMIMLGEAVEKLDYNAIISICEGGVEATPEVIEFYYYLAVAYYHEKREEEAMKTCLGALEYIMDDTNADVVTDIYTILGDIYHARGQQQQAYDAYDNALKFKSDNIGVLNNYAYFLSLDGRDLDKAEEMSYRTIKAEPNNPTYLDTYAWILFQKGSYEQARIYIDETLKNDKEPSADVLEHAGDIYFKAGDVQKAVNFWKRAAEQGEASDVLKQKIETKQYVAPKK